LGIATNSFQAGKLIFLQQISAVCNLFRVWGLLSRGLLTMRVRTTLAKPVGAEQTQSLFVAALVIKGTESVSFGLERMESRKCRVGVGA